MSVKKPCRCSGGQFCERESGTIPESCVNDVWMAWKRFRPQTYEVLRTLRDMMWWDENNQASKSVKEMQEKWEAIIDLYWDEYYRLFPDGKPPCTNV